MTPRDDTAESPLVLTFGPYLLTLITAQLVGAVVDNWDSWTAATSWWLR